MIQAADHDSFLITLAPAAARHKRKSASEKIGNGTRSHPLICIKPIIIHVTDMKDAWKLIVSAPLRSSTCQEQRERIHGQDRWGSDPHELPETGLPVFNQQDKLSFSLEVYFLFIKISQLS